MRFYILQINLGDYEAGRIVSLDENGSWLMAKDDYLDTRSSIIRGELAILLDEARHRKLTAILEPLDDEDKSHD